MSDFKSFELDGAMTELSPETHSHFRKFLQAAGIDNVITDDGRHITDPEVFNEISQECAILSLNRDEIRATSLIQACSNGDEELVRRLLESGECSINDLGPCGESALTCAVSANAEHIVELLLRHGVS